MTIYILYFTVYRCANGAPLNSVAQQRSSAGANSHNTVETARGAREYRPAGAEPRTQVPCINGAPNLCMLLLATSTLCTCNT